MEESTEKPGSNADFYNNLAMGNAVAQQQANNQLILAITAKMTASIMESSEMNTPSDMMEMIKMLQEVNK